MSVENCTFKGNYAKESGGAIFWTGWLVLKPFSYFDSNIADTRVVFVFFYSIFFVF